MSTENILPQIRKTRRAKKETTYNARVIHYTFFVKKKKKESLNSFRVGCYVLQYNFRKKKPFPNYYYFF